MKFKRIFAVLLGTMISFSSIPYSFAYPKNNSIAFVAEAADGVKSGKCGENVTCTYDGNGLLTISGTGDMSDCEAYSNVFYVDTQIPCHNIINVVINEGVTGIGKKAFNNCSNMKSISIPSTISKIGEDAFYACQSLEDITISDKNTSFCTDSGVMYDKNKTKIISAFAKKELTSFTIPKSVKTIEASAFSRCNNISSITIPDNVESIGANAFAACANLNEVIIENPDCKIYGSNVTFYNKLTDGQNNYLFDGTFYGYQTSTTADYAAYYNRKFISFEEQLPEQTDPYSGHCGYKVTWKYDNGKLTLSGTGRTFDYMHSSNFAPWSDFAADIKEVEVGSGITYIGSDLFCQCINLKTVNLPDTLTKIGFEAFSQCKSLEKIDLPNSVTVIGNGAFSYCSKLTEITLSSGITEIPSNMFGDCQSLSKVIIPDSVTSIGAGAFWNTKSLKELQLPKNLVSIETGAFRASGINNIEFPNSLIRICPESFIDCNDLSSVLIPQNVNYVGQKTSETSPYGKVFSANTKVNVSSYNKDFCSENGILFNKNKTVLMHYPTNASTKEYIIPSSVEEIGIGAFMGSNIEKVTLSEKVNIISQSAFYECKNLEKIDLPASVKETKIFSFTECSNLNAIIFRNPDCNIDASTLDYPAEKFNGIIYGYDNSTAQKHAKKYNYKFSIIDDTSTTTTTQNITTTTTTSTTQVTTTTTIDYRPFSGKCGENVFWEFDGNHTLTISGTGIMYNRGSAEGPSPWYDVQNRIKNVVIKNGVESIGATAFGSMENLQSIEIPDSIISIESYAFDGCKSLKEISLPNNLQKIGKEVFAYCSSLSSIKIPSSITEIGEGAFGRCSNLQEIIIDDNDYYISIDGVLYNKDISSLLAYPAKKSDTTYSVPSSVKRIEQSAFMSCDNLVKINLPLNLEYIGNSAFAGASNLSSINISDTINYIGDRAFQNCTSLTSVNIPKELTIINDSVFANCSKIKTITLPETIKEIKWYAFSGCSGMTDIYILNPECKIENYGEETISSTATIHGYKESTAEKYANSKKRNFVELAQVTTTTTTSKIITTTTTSKASTTTSKASTTTSKASTTTSKASTTTSKASTTTSKASTTISTTLTTSKVITTTTTTEKSFVNGADNWSFSNSRNNFGNTYYMNSEYWNKLISGLSNKEKTEIDYYIHHRQWNGSCYGMAATSILASYGILKPSNWQENANFLHDISGPPSDEVKSLINYYFALQMTDAVEQSAANQAYAKNEKVKIDYLLSCLKDGSPVLLGFYFPGGGHAVVAYDVEYGTFVRNGKAYNGKVVIYDNNRIDYDDDYCLYFNSSDGSWMIPNTYYNANSENGSLGFITDDLRIINYHGYIDGMNDFTTSDYIAVLKSPKIAGDYKLIKATYNSGTWLNSTTSEDDIKMFSTFEDDIVSTNVKFAMKDSSSGYIMELKSPNELDLSLSYSDSLLKANASAGSTAKFSPSDCVSISGKDTNYNLTIVLNEGYTVTDWYSFSVNGNDVNEATLEKTNNGYILKASNLKNVSAQAHNDDVTAKVTFSTDYSKVFLYEKDEHTIGVAVDTDENGTFETEIEVITLAMGDVNNDGFINAVDASSVLSYYAMISTNKDGGFDDNQKTAADVNHDGFINAVDASCILSYYAYVSTTREEVKSIEEYLKK